MKKDGNGTIIRVQKNKNYTVMSNYHLESKTLSWKTKGLMSYMLSVRDDWNFSINGLVKMGKGGRDLIRGMLKELEAEGYLTRHQGRKKDGSWGEVTYVLREHPQVPSLPVLSQDEIPMYEIPQSVFPPSVKPTLESSISANPIQTSTNITSTDITSKKASQQSNNLMALYYEREEGRRKQYDI